MTALQALIVEDEQDLNEIFDEILCNGGLVTQLAHDGRQAMTMLETYTPDIILLDLNLPYVSGDEILKFIRSTDRLKHCKVMITSANAHIATELDDEADLILFKPVSVAQLMAFVQRLISMVKNTPA